MIDLNRLLNAVAQIDQDRSDLHRRLHLLCEALIEFAESPQYPGDARALVVQCKLASGSARSDRRMN